MPEPTHVGEKPKSGFPKWGKEIDPITWFALIRDTTKRYSESTLPICSDDFFGDSGPKKVDYYVLLWQELKARYKSLFEDPEY